MRRKNYKLYTLPKQVKKMSMAGNAFWMHSVTIALLVLGLSLLDAATLYTVFDGLMHGNYGLKLFLTLGCAVVLNIIPLIVARFVHLYRYHRDGVKLWAVLALCVLFLVLFCTTFYLRWQTRATTFGTLQTGVQIETKATGAAGGEKEEALSTDPNSPDAIALTVFLGVMPMITSAINFALGYLNDDPMKRKLEQLRYQRAVLAEQVDVMNAAELELDQDWASILAGLEEARLDAAREEVRRGSDAIRALGRLALAKKLGDADSISELTDTTDPTPDPQEEADALPDGEEGP